MEPVGEHLKTCVIVPTYNERGNIAAFIGAVYGAMKGDVTVCVVDDNSPDGTGEEVKNLKALFPSLILITRAGKEGLGRAYVHGFTEMLARDEFDVFVMIDADFSEHPAYIPQLVSHFSHADVVTGLRRGPGSATVGWPLKRKILSTLANMYAGVIMQMPLQDVTFGFGAIRTSFLKKIDLSKTEAKGYAFIMQLKYELYRAGARFHEMPIVFTERTIGVSKLSGDALFEALAVPWRLRFGHDKKS